MGSEISGKIRRFRKDMVEEHREREKIKERGLR